jgi:two-component system phosphate regulon sensor histidine kinase PhoR
VTDRWATFKGALLAGGAVLAVLAWKGQLDAMSVGAAVLAAIAILVLPSRRRPAASHRSEAPLEERPAAADTLLSNIPDPVILVDRRVLVRGANEAARALLPNLQVQHPLSFALRAPDILDGIGQVLRTGEPQRVEYHPRIPAERAFEVQIGPVRSDGTGDARSGALLFFRDLTAAHRLEHMRVDFVANASHELRTPLASLLGFIETLEGAARHDPAARERFLPIMRGQAQRMARLIDDLLSLSRIELRAHLHPETPVDLLPIVKQMIDTMAPLARDVGVEIALHAVEASHMILGDRDEIARLMENLIGNALNYGASGKRVDVTLARTQALNGLPSRVELEVRDYGPGIAAGHLPRLTERFYRANAAESRQKGGTGLGLAIVKHIVARHRGRLRIESEVGHGAVFRVVFPGFGP